MKALALIGFVFVFHAGMAQYTVTAVKGKVYQGQKLVLVGDQLGETTNLTATDKSAGLRVLHAQHGAFIVLFTSGKRTRLSVDPTPGSELYQLTIGSYVQSFVLSRSSLKTKDGLAFDWVRFFYEVSSDTTGHRMLFIKGQSIPLTSAVFNSSVRFTLFARVFTNSFNDARGDSSLTELPIQHDSLLVDFKNIKTGKRFAWKLGMRTTDPGDPMNWVTDNRLNGIIIERAVLADVISFAAAGQRNTPEARKNIYDLLLFEYGTFYPHDVDVLIDKALAAP